MDLCLCDPTIVTVCFKSCVFMCSAVPSTELVNKVRDLYERSGQDVRFLIPILNGLEKVLQL